MAHSQHLRSNQWENTFSGQLSPFLKIRVTSWALLSVFEALFLTKAQRQELERHTRVRHFLALPGFAWLTSLLTPGWMAPGWDSSKSVHGWLHFTGLHLAHTCAHASSCTEL